MLSWQVGVGSRRSAELIGSGDVLAPPPDDSASYAVVAEHVTCRVLEPTWVAVLDAAFCGRVTPWASILTELLKRSGWRSRSLAVRLAIAQVPNLGDRLLLLLWHLADRWGQVLPDGVLLPLRLSHETLAELACAQRPSVSVALRQLAERDLVVRATGRGWQLRGNPPAELVALLRDGPATSSLSRERQGSYTFR
jgi:hypothetical protein